MAPAATRLTSKHRTWYSLFHSLDKSDGFCACLACNPQTHYHVVEDASSKIRAQLLHPSSHWPQYARRMASRWLYSSLRGAHPLDTGKTLDYRVGSYCWTEEQRIPLSAWAFAVPVSSTPHSKSHSGMMQMQSLKIKSIETVSTGIDKLKWANM